MGCQRDRLGYIDGLNTYAAWFIPNGVDPTGLAKALYAFASTGESYGETPPRITQRLYDAINRPGKYFDGVGSSWSPGWNEINPNAATGSGMAQIWEEGVGKICKDVCEGRVASRGEINLFGYSRGAVVAIEIARELGVHGCCCQRNWWGLNCCDRRYPKVNWLGLCDPVSMDLFGEMGPMQGLVENVNTVSLARSTGDTWIGDWLFWPLQVVGMDGLLVTPKNFPIGHDELGYDAGVRTWFLAEARAAGL